MKKLKTKTKVAEADTIPVYNMEQVKHLLPSKPPAGFDWEDVPLIGKGSIIWRKHPGGATVDYEAMCARDRAIDENLN